MPKGIIKFFSERRGYGFISFSDVTEGQNARNEVFVHYSQISHDGYRTLKEGEEVTFDLKEGNRGLEAINVQKLS